MAYQVLWANDALTTLAATITNSQTTITVTSGAGALFPNPGTGQFFALTLISSTNPATYEIVYCTARSTDTLTVTRAQEGTTAKAFNAGDFAQNLLTSGTMALLVQPSEAWTWSATQTYSTSPVLNNNVGLLAKSPGGALTNIIGYFASGYVGVYGGADGFFVGNNAATENNLLMDDSGNVTFRGSVTASEDANGFNVKFGSSSYESGWQNNGTVTYFLLTGGGGGGYNSLRPMAVNNVTGAVNFDETGAGVGFGGTVAAAGTVSAANATSSGQLVALGQFTRYFSAENNYYTKTPDGSVDLTFSAAVNYGPGLVTTNVSLPSFYAGFPNTMCDAIVCFDGTTPPFYGLSCQPVSDSVVSVTVNNPGSASGTGVGVVIRCRGF